MINRNLIEKIKIPEGCRVPVIGGRLYKFLSQVDNYLIKTENLTMPVLNIEKRDIYITASLTSYPARINRVWLAIKSIMLQSCKPDRIILWLAEEQFPEKKIPENLVSLLEYGLEIRWCKDLCGHKKYFYCIKEQKPDEVVITFDDDIIYPPLCIERLIKKHKEFPGCLVCERGQAVEYENNGKIKNPGRWDVSSDIGVNKPSYSINPSPGGGCLIPYNVFYKDVCDETKIRELAYKNDDLWYMFMAAKNGTKTIKTQKNHKVFSLIDGTQMEQLAIENVIGGKNLVALEALREAYPDAYTKITTDCEYGGVGIVTLIGNENYGNKLQNYAMEKLLSEYGAVTSYRIGSMQKLRSDKGFFVKNINDIKQKLQVRILKNSGIVDVSRGWLNVIIYAVLNYKKIKMLKKERQKRIELFSYNYLHIANDDISFFNANDEKIVDKYFFAVGSDQVWAPNNIYTTELSFLSFAKNKSIAIAPSFGTTIISEERRKQYANWIDNIQYLSVREESGKEIIKELTGREAEVLLDPCLLIEYETWEHMEKKPTVLLPKHYVVCYFLRKYNMSRKKEIMAFCKKYDIEMVKLYDIEMPEYYVFDPQEFLYAIRHADFILTDSYHGCIFAILFHKNFFVFDGNNNPGSHDPRFETLFDVFDMHSRKFNKNYNAISEEEWQSVDEIIHRERYKAINYIQNSVQEIMNREVV